MRSYRNVESSRQHPWAIRILAFDLLLICSLKEYIENREAYDICTPSALVSFFSSMCMVDQVMLGWM